MYTEGKENNREIIWKEINPEEFLYGTGDSLKMNIKAC